MMAVVWVGEGEEDTTRHVKKTETEKERTKNERQKRGEDRKKERMGDDGETTWRKRERERDAPSKELC